MITIPLTITGATAPYNISVKKQGDSTERFVSYYNTTLKINSVDENVLSTYTVYITDANKCTAQKNFDLFCDGINCDIPYDIVILLDESGSIINNAQNPDFNRAQAGVEIIINTLRSYMQNQIIKLGIVLFGNSDINNCVRVVSSLNYDAQSTINAMYSLPQGKGATPLLKGLIVGYDVLTATHPGTEGTTRGNVNKKLIVITDGNPNQGSNCENLTIEAAKATAANHANNIKTTTFNNIYKTKIITVGVGSNIDNDFLKNQIASDQNHFTINSYEQFTQIAEQIAKEICK